MISVDLNCDMGEGMLTDEAIMPYISSANIACGFHAGDEATIRKTISLCKKYNVAIGAHPGFDDKKKFGRTPVQLSATELYELFFRQIILLKDLAESVGSYLHHVKPHGALYNMAANNKVYAQTILKATKDVDANLIFYGLSNSCMIDEAVNLKVKTASEVFADRTYQDDGTLTPRTEPYALIEDADKAANQALQMADTKTVITVTGKTIALQPDTICIHGDGAHAVAFAKTIYETLQKQCIQIESI